MLKPCAVITGTLLAPVWDHGFESRSLHGCVLLPCARTVIAMRRNMSMIHTYTSRR